ncbi:MULTISPECIES: glycosyltransferase family 4 protein [Gammaproteobacteria]|uniref:glycosyltransferase family 4 protein n=1 Tax=Gammaproteobacteria TaxID=1236 RepID=UPI000DD0236D|nr:MULTISPECIES: glycosyltransferase family 4 protein [Gammaproteobacteria]RTE86058.1 glycosyltransferase WbuB [Aliidiomarina sp. B3213]TCZ91412.1 glycosyltransferase WbuB [Lysobacter sp. N42]
MRVLYFHQHFSTPKGAAGIRSYQMARRLIDRGHQVTMVCGSYSGGQTGLSSDFVGGKRSGKVDGIDVIEFDLAYANSDGFVKRAALFFKFAMKSIGIALRHDYDVLFATSTPLTAGIPGVFARWLRGKPFVFEVRDLWPELPKAMGVITNPVVLFAMSCLEWLSYRSAHRCIALAPGIANGIAKRGVSEIKISTIPNGCDLSIFEDYGQSWRPKGVRSDDLMAVFAGTHGIANGLDAAIDAAAELKKRERNDIKLVLIGQGKLKSALQKRAKRLELDNVIFHNSVPKKKLAGLMASTDLGMQLLANVPAFYDGTSPNKFFDYIASGVPVLNNYPGWLAAYIKNEQCGFTVEPGNPSAFADSLEVAANDRLLLKEMGGRAKHLAKTQFNREILADEWVSWVLGVKK